MNLSCGVFAVLLGFLTNWSLLAQNLTFEVASVKPNTSGREGGSLGPRGDRLVGTNVTLRNLMIFAFRPSNGLFLRQQIIGGPQWMDTDHFDIEAKLEGSARSIPAEQLRLMLQALLEELEVVVIDSVQKPSEN